MRNLIDLILQQRDRVAELQRQLTRLQAISPENGGHGEMEKANFIRQMLIRAGVSDILEIDAPDLRIRGGGRPNIIARIPGRSSRNLWLFGHMDVVPPGDLNLWRNDPWEAVQDGDKIFGRGTEDNQQAIVSMLILLETLQIAEIEPTLGLRLVFMADEENGSKYGLEWILDHEADLFSKDDLFIVPDGGVPEGDAIEIAEKAQLWLKFKVFGQQCHASTPNRGINSLVAASALILKLNSLNSLFTERDPLFQPPASTFTPTMHDQNVQAVNISPGLDIFYLDCRLIPESRPDDALEQIHRMSEKVEQEYGVRISVETIQFQPASHTPASASVVRALERAISQVIHVKPRVYGIGGATVASFLRRRGLPTAVWATIHNTCHQPNEYSSISNTCQDAAVFGHILLDASNGR